MSSLPTTGNVIILGQIGSGKTLLARHLIRSQPRVLILDTFKDHDFGFTTSSLWEAARNLKRERFCIVLRDFKIGLRLRWIFHCVSERGDMALLVEELSFYAKANWSIPGLRDLLRNSRHAGVRFLATSQVPAQVDKEVISHCQTVLCGRLTEPNALGYLRKIWDGADQVARLPLPVISNGQATVSFYRLPEGCREVISINL